VAITGFISKVGKIAGNNQSTILTGMGVTGVVTTVIFTTRATFKAAELIEREERKAQDSTGDLEYELNTKAKVKLIWPLYIPPASVAVTTIAAIVMANHEASKKIAALTVASGISERALQEYKDKVIEKLGDKKAVDIRDSIAQDRVNKTPLNTREIIIAGTGEVLCFDITTGRYFQSSVEEIRRAENKINFEIINHMYSSLSSFYDEIGLPPTPYSDTVGWNGNELFEVTLSTVLSPDNRPCVAIDFVRAPFAEYDRLW
jgi:hypothetical protein